MFSLEQFPLNYARTGLEPFMSEQTIDFHYGKHLATYITNLNGFISGTKYESMPLLDIVHESAKDAVAAKIFNNAAQIFNHNFFFSGLTPNGGGLVPDSVANAFGDFKKEFTDAALGVFGSGWVWLTQGADGKLAIETSAYADTPIAHDRMPLLTLDVWEHAYYLQHQNRRADFIASFLEHLVDWEFVLSNLK